MLITMYSFLPFPIETREDFELPAWPQTKNKEHFKLFEDYMKSFKVFYYHDSDKKADGSITSPIIFDFIRDDETFFPYKFIFMNILHVDSKDFKVINWPADKQSNLLSKLEQHPVGKDMKAWRSWNVQCVFDGFPNGLVKRTIVEETLDKDLSLVIEDLKPQIGRIQ